MILCCGEALIDMIPEPTKSGLSGFVPYTGGAVFNTAIALGRIGARAGMLTGLSTDMFGQQLADALAGCGVDTRLILRSERPTTLAFVHLQAGQASYTFVDENTAGRMLHPTDLPAIPESVEALFLGGISLAVEPCAKAYTALALREGPSRVVMLDPNIRPGFIRDETRYRDRLQALLALADLVKISVEDLGWIYPDATDHDDGVERLREACRGLILVTKGADGSVAVLPDGRRVLRAASNITVRDTVGAGDTFNAGILASLQRQGLLTKEGIAGLDEAALGAALDLATRMAAITVSRAGANPPWLSELA